jgi:hypothetical protein
MSDGIVRNYFNRSGSSDVNYLEPADIILFEASEPQGAIVSRFQLAVGYETPAAHIVHTAIYIGYGAICHALPYVDVGRPFGGIIVQRAWDALQTDSRLVYVLRDSTLSAEERRDIALYAASRSMQDSGYDWKGVIRLLVNLAESYNKKGTPKPIASFMLDFYAAMAKWFILGRDHDPSRRANASTSEIVAPADIFDSGVAEALQEQDPMGLMKEAGVSSFICSDFTSHCYNFIMKKRSPFSNKLDLRLPLVAPADVFLTAGFVSVKTKAKSDQVTKFRELTKRAMRG